MPDAAILFVGLFESAPSGVRLLGRLSEDDLVDELRSRIAALKRAEADEISSSVKTASVRGLRPVRSPETNQTPAGSGEPT